MRLLTLSLFATLLSAPAFAADLGTYRPGTPYNSAVAGSADACDSQCSGDAQCRGWNYVKPNPNAAGICEFLSSVSSPISSPISVSGESFAASSFSSRVTSGGTNTVRVGTPAVPVSSISRLGQTSPSGRRVVRESVPTRARSQQASTRPVQDMSLTAQQNRYRQAQGLTQGQPRTPQIAPRQQIQPRFQPVPPVQRPAFRPLLDAPTPPNGQQFRQPQAQPTQQQGSRRITGPRRVQGQIPGQGQATPQFQDPRVQKLRARNPQAQNPQASNPQARDPRLQNPQGQSVPPQDPRFQNQQATRQQAQAQPFANGRGQSRPPVGQPIAAPQRPTRPQPLTPSQRLAQLAASTPAQENVPISGPIALSPDQARKSLFGRLNDDIPTAQSVPTGPVTEQPLGEVLAGGL